jgi:hypothetical protein
MDSQQRRYITIDRPVQKIPAGPFAERRQNVRNLNLALFVHSHGTRHRFLCRAFMQRVLAEVMPALIAEAERIDQTEREGSPS